MYTGNKCIYIHLYIPSNLIPGLKGGPPYWSTIFNYLPKCVTMLMSHPHSYPEGPLFKAFQFPHDVCWSRPANSGSTILPVCLLNVKSCYLTVFQQDLRAYEGSPYSSPHPPRSDITYSGATVAAEGTQAAKKVLNPYATVPPIGNVAPVADNLTYTGSYLLAHQVVCLDLCF